VIDDGLCLVRWLTPLPGSTSRGRNLEIPSEDPFLTAQYAIGYTTGLQQGPDPAVPMAAVTLKHWLGNSVEGGVGHASRHTADAQISPYDLTNTYYPGFELTIKSGDTLDHAMGVMCSCKRPLLHSSGHDMLTRYSLLVLLTLSADNMLNGKPTCGNPDLTAVLRQDWQFK